MRTGLMASVAAALAGTGLALAQTAPTTPVEPRNMSVGNRVVPNVTPALVDSHPAGNTEKKSDACPPSELPAAPFDPGWGIWVPNGPNAFSAPERKSS